MVITYYGALCFKVQSGETVLAFNPPSSKSEYKSPRFASDIDVKGIKTNGLDNVVYTVALEDISICHLGALSKEMDPQLKEEVGEVDILFIPIGGGELLEPQRAAGAAIHLEPKIVIPMNYNESQLKQFIKEFGPVASGMTPVEKLTIKKKDLADKKGEVVILKSAV